MIDRDAHGKSLGDIFRLDGTPVPPVIQEIALADERTQISLAGKPVKKVIIVPGRMVNIVTG